MPWGLIAIGALVAGAAGFGVGAGLSVGRNTMTTIGLVAGGVWLWQRYK